ncbi:MAG TPA: site-2 protease family protein [Bryobacteraceae bacterium]
MRWSWKIAEVLGIRVYIHATFWLLILFVLYSSWSRGHTAAQTALGVIFILAIFGCVVLHEFGHALMARHYGIRTRDITLLPIGGLARLERMPDDPKQELLVALAGPAVNVVIAAALFLGSAAVGARFEWVDFNWLGGNLLTGLMDVNIWLVLFNLIPAFPMDGGRVLRALLAIRMEYTRATRIAARTGQGIAFLFGLAGLFGNPFLLFIALFVWLGAEQEAAGVQLRSAIAGIPVERVMLRDFQVLGPGDQVAAAIGHAVASGQQEFPVVSGSQVLGILTRRDLVRAIQQHGAEAPVSMVMEHDIQMVDSYEMLDNVIGRLSESKTRALPVIHGGLLVGMLTMENVAEFLMIRKAVKDMGHAGVGRTVHTGREREPN